MQDAGNGVRFVAQQIISTETVHADQQQRWHIKTVEMNRKMGRNIVFARVQFAIPSFPISALCIAFPLASVRSPTAVLVQEFCILFELLPLLIGDHDHPNQGDDQQKGKHRQQRNHNTQETATAQQTAKRRTSGGWAAAAKPFVTGRVRPCRDANLPPKWKYKMGSQWSKTRNNNVQLQLLQLKSIN